MMRGNSIIAFHHVFMISFYAVTLQKLFFTDETLKRHTFNFKHYVRKTYLHQKVHFGLNSNNGKQTKWVLNMASLHIYPKK